MSGGDPDSYSAFLAEMDRAELPEGARWSHVYGLVDPESGEIRYIGKSIRPLQRLQNHMNERSRCHRSHWLQSIKARGLTPELVILESVAGEWPWQESERRWIELGRRMGWPLTNNTSGGDGVSNLPEETRARMREVAGADCRFGPFHSSHEGLGVLMEEVHELIEAIRSNDCASVRKEALQVSAVAMRLAQACDTSEDFRVRSGFNNGR